MIKVFALWVTLQVRPPQKKTSEKLFKLTHFLYIILHLTHRIKNYKSCFYAFTGRNT